MIYLILGGVGWLIGAIGFRQWGWLFGLLMGLMAAEVFRLRRRIGRLEEKAAAGATASSSERPASIKSDDPVGTKTSEDIVFDFPEESSPEWEGGVGKVMPDPVPEPLFATPEKASFSKPPSPDIVPVSGGEASAAPVSGSPVENWMDRAVQWVKRFFTTGNVVTKVGVIILFFGVAFLLKYAAQRSLFPIELRLGCVFAAGVGLVVTGWRLRNRKMAYGLLLQGVGVGVLYLTIYASARFYHLLPYGFSFVMMFCLVVLSGIMAILQNSKAMAVTGIVGGFLAPVLISTGNGSHVALFLYYAVLNLGIVGISWKKAWRGLNVVGFYFTFVIAAVWGGKYYRPRYFSSTEPFLILFFLYYVAISVMYSLRQRPNLKGYVDGTLVFGLPVVSFGLQYCLVRNYEYGMAVSALTLGLFYIGLATFLWRRGKEPLRMMAESFLAFGIVFGSLAIPLALDGRWTSAAWAIEGGAILWIGIRQQRFIPRLFGLLLQAGAGIFFLASIDRPYVQVPVANSFFVGCNLISLAGLFSGWYLNRNSGKLYKGEALAATPLMVWGLAWWFGAAFIEIHRFIAGRDRMAVWLVHGTASFLITDFLSRRISWRQLGYPSILLLPLMICLALLGSTAGDLHLFARWGAIAWLAAVIVNYRILFICEAVWPERAVFLWHLLSFWLLTFIFSTESAYYIELLAGGGVWQHCAWGVVPGLIAIVLLLKGGDLSWPVRRFQTAYFGPGVGTILVYLLFWTLFANIREADPAPIAYLPLFNPLELSQVFIFLVFLKSIVFRRFWPDSASAGILKTVSYGTGFFLLNAMVARTVHFWGHVPYSPPGLYRSVLFQAAISILWGGTALGTTLWATRKGSRPAWIAGAVILALVVVKLFVVDLSGSGTVARIISFIGVGSLMLLIGYFSPMPPAAPREES